MAHPRTEVVDITAYYSFIYPECYGTKQRKGLRQSRNWPQVGPTGPEENLRHGPLHFVFGLFGRPLGLGLCHRKSVRLSVCNVGGVLAE